MTLKPALSAYLDFLRFLAALAVMLGHMNQDGLFMDWMPLSHFSHEAVMIFFVLSGFIIYYSTTTRASSLRQYAIARMSRIYSVALPAVVFSTLLAILVSKQADFNAATLSNYSEPSAWSTFSSLLFLNASWLNEADVPLNNPYWSLCYEVWFYVLFGAYHFVKGWKRYFFVALAALVAGPAILVLLPIWLMGAYLAASGKFDLRWRQGAAWAGFLGPLLAIAIINMTHVDSMIRSALFANIPGFWRLDSSQRFLTDYLIGAALCLHIAAFSSLPVRVQALFTRHRRTWAALAGFSFTLYLFHRPLTQLLGAYFPVAQGDVLHSCLVALGLLMACWVISWGTEKQLSLWRHQFSRLLTKQG